MHLEIKSSLFINFGCYAYNVEKASKNKHTNTIK